MNYLYAIAIISICFALIHILKYKEMCQWLAGLINEKFLVHNPYENSMWALVIPQAIVVYSLINRILAALYDRGVIEEETIYAHAAIIVMVGGLVLANFLIVQSEVRGQMSVENDGLQVVIGPRSKSGGWAYIFSLILALSALAIIVVASKSGGN